MTVGIRKPGEFCWVNMITPEPARARAFYEKVLGWSVTEMPGMGWTLQAGGRAFGAMFDIAAPSTPPGTRPQLGVMVMVENADATAKRVAELGGTARPPFDIMDRGRMAVCFDPGGAQFDVWQPKQSHLTDVDSAVPGAPSWFEVMTHDAGRTAKFYSALFGWKAEVMPGAQPPYSTFSLAGAGVAGMLTLEGPMASLPEQWGVYFNVTDVDRAAKDAEASGGTVVVPPRDIPTVGQFCGIASPAGIACYAAKWLPRG